VPVATSGGERVAGQRIHPVRDGYRVSVRQSRLVHALAIVAAYAAVATGSIAVFSEVLGSEGLSYVLVPVAHVLYGLAVGRWWVLLLPMPLAVALGVPGAPDAHGTDPVWWTFILLGVPGTISLAAGVAARKLGCRVVAPKPRGPYADRKHAAPPRLQHPTG
jgi:hypothetical protein